MNRPDRTVVFFLVVGIAVALIGGAFLIVKVLDNNAENRQAQFEACQRSNKQLRFVINQRIVRPFETVVGIAATPSGDPAFDVYVPPYQKALDQIEPVPYAICRNTYPLDGSDPHPPYFRDAKLPAPLKANKRSQGDSPEKGSKGPRSPQNASNATQGVSSQTSAPPPSQQPAPPSNGGGDNPTTPPPTNPPPNNPSPSGGGGLLDDVNDLVCGLTPGGLPILC